MESTQLFYYQAYGLAINSTVELPALSFANEHTNCLSPISVRSGICPKKLSSEPLFTSAECLLNQTEFLLSIPGVATYYVRDGNQVIIEAFSTNWHGVCLYVYSNCLSIALLQRDLFIAHVSGVFLTPREVVLLAAPSGTGKSTTALKLSELGYKLFTDDTALLTSQTNSCVARASYPMAKIWNETIDYQGAFAASDKIKIYQSGIDKFGFTYHESFVDTEVVVKAIVFLEEKGTEMITTTVNAAEQVGLLGINIYRNEWVLAMKKQQLLFDYIISISKHVPAWKAIRPVSMKTFDAFAKLIDVQILQQLPSVVAIN